MRIQLDTNRPSRRGMRAPATAGFAAGSAAGASALYFLDPVSGRRRRKVAVDRAAATVRRTVRRTARAARGAETMVHGRARRLVHRRKPKQLDDVTLARKVETVIFRDPAVPKGEIDVNVQRGVVQLRGVVPTRDLLDELVARTRAVQGVREVESLLHLASEPAPMHQ